MAHIEALGTGVVDVVVVQAGVVLSERAARVLAMTARVALGGDAGKVRAGHLQPLDFHVRAPGINGDSVAGGSLYLDAIGRGRVAGPCQAQVARAPDLDAARREPRQVSDRDVASVMISMGWAAVPCRSSMPMALKCPGCRQMREPGAMPAPLICP